MTLLRFPKDFLWGAATSSHQVEGHTRNDWSEWEKKNAVRLAKEAYKKFGHLPHWERIQPEAENPKNYLSGAACDHYKKFREDFDLAQSLHHNAHRFSIEWSRIEPEEGKFNQEAIDHYHEVLTTLHERGLEPFVTLWHWTLPLWLAEKGGVHSQEFPKYFERYAKHIVSQYKNEVRFWITLNEPTSVIGASYVNGNWPPQEKSLWRAYRVFHILARAHNRAFHAIHKIDSNAEVGLANILQSFVPYQKTSWLDKLSVSIAHFFTNEYMLRLTRGHHDFLTVQYYFHNRLKFIRRDHNKDHSESDLGWEVYPEGIFHILRWLNSFHLPLYITENGLADALDTKRESFIKEHLRFIHQAIEMGIDVRGYFYWSLLDNFEWDKGFWPRFGLIEIDYVTQKRTVRPSALAYGKIAETHTLEF
ncbi:MAG: glycoside hydrolase family 1 protein [Candidatus Moranbacteria bacterium]|nr:glycoside hydrolase family 1 protein [Candidatus Moranbacteria bacterium]